MLDHSIPRISSNPFQFCFIEQQFAGLKFFCPMAPNDCFLKLWPARLAHKLPESIAQLSSN